MCNDSSHTSPCNRRPFASDDRCDRGSVDIFQFGDLPYCGTIDPTLPEIPPEVQDFPVPIPLPTYSCTCFNIDYKFDLKYNENRAGNSFSTSASFVAIGDCCEGRYESKFKLRIPCPVKNKEGRKIKVGISYGSGPQSASASFIAADSSNCVIEPLSPTLSLNIPCPIKNDMGGKMKIGIAYGDGKASATESFIRGNSSTCEMEALNPDFKLEIPCPAKGVGTKKISAKIEYGDGPQSASDTFIKADPDKCQIDAYNADLKLNLPCPLLGEGGENKISASIAYGDGPGNAEGVFAVTDPENCTVDMQSPKLKLNIPCPDITFSTISKSEYTDEGKLTLSQANDDVKCSKAVTLSAVFPLGTGYTGLVRYLDELTFAGGSLVASYKYVQYKNGRAVKRYDGGQVTVFTSVPHGGCC